VGTGSCQTGVATATNCKVTTNGDGQVTVAYLNVATEVVRTVAPGNIVTTDTYDDTGNVATTTTASGKTTDGYDKDNRLTSVTYSDTAAGFATPANVTVTYNADGQRTKMTDGTGTTTDTYGALGQLASVTDGAGKTVSYTYNADDQVTALTYPDTKTVHRAYNGAGQMTSTTDLTGETTTFGYSLTPAGVPGGSQMTTTSPNWQTEITTANALGQAVTTALPAKTSWTSTALPGGTTSGWQGSISCPTSTMCVAVGNTGHLWSSADPSGGSGAWARVTVGSSSTLTAISCPSTTFCVAGDEGGDLFVSTDPTGGASSWREVPLSRRHWISAISCPTTSLCVAVTETSTIWTSTDPTGGSTAWTATDISTADGFSAVDCPSSTLCVAGTTTGSLYASTDPTGGSSTWTKEYQRIRTPGYWAAITGISCPSTSFCAAVTSTNGDRSLLSAPYLYYSTNPDSPTWSLHVLAGGQTTGGARGVSCPTTTYCVAVGDGIVWTSTDPEGATPDGTVAAWTPTTWTPGTSTPATVGGVSTIFGVSCPTATLCAAVGATAYGTVTALTMARGSHTYRYSATYDADGTLAGTTERVGATVVSQTTYGYDANSQLTSSSTPGTPGGTGTYAYDGAGDPTATVDPATGAAVTQAFGTDGEVETATPAGGTATTFAYDALGNRTSAAVGGAKTATYSYNQAAELTASTTSSGTVTYAYNGEGLRMSQTTGSGTTQFTWDTEASTPELLSNGSEYFIYGPTGQVIEQESTTPANPDPEYLVHNALGSTVALTNSTEQISTYTYSAYGAVTNHSGPDTTPIGFAGGYRDDTGLIYLTHRFYTPSTGEFLSVDPKVATTHEPYEYATDDPVNMSDPSGLSSRFSKVTTTLVDPSGSIWVYTSFMNDINAGDSLESSLHTLWYGVWQHGTSIGAEATKLLASLSSYADDLSDSSDACGSSSDHFYSFACSVGVILKNGNGGGNYTSVSYFSGAGTDSLIYIVIHYHENLTELAQLGLDLYRTVLTHISGKAEATVSGCPTTTIAV
jgi:RHS repeat-associated protein